jgi:hypothetical protein
VQERACALFEPARRLPVARFMGKLMITILVVITIISGYATGVFSVLGVRRIVKRIKG